MNARSSLARALTAALLAVTAAWSLAQVAYAGPEEPDVPTAVQVPAGHTLFLVGHAVGVQIYSCNPTAGGYEWSFVGPRADVYGRNGKLVMTHFGGPTWLARDGSRVVGRVAGRADGGPNAIQLLLLEAASKSTGADGDRLAGTTYIQRLATSGGLAPAAATCNADTAGTQAEVPYTADYTFWKAIGG